MVKNKEKWEMSYYVSLMQWVDGISSFQKDIVRTNLKILKEAGVDIVGVNGISLLDPADYNIPEAVLELKKWLGEFNFRVNSYHYWGPTFGPLDGKQDIVRKNLLANIDVFRELAPRCFVIHPGVIFVNDTATDNGIKAYERQAAKYGENDILQTVADNLRIMSRHAAKYDIKLALENTGYFLPLGQFGNLPRLIETINEPNVGYCVDSGHAHGYGESVTDWLRQASEKLFEIHLHDNRSLGSGFPKEIVADDGTVDEHLPLGFGTINWIDVIQTLHKIGFHGPITFEYPGWPVKDRVQGYRLSMDWWRTCVKIALNSG